MYLLGLAVLLSLLKWLEVGPVAGWSWWVILALYGATALWWFWADSSGYTRRKATERMEERTRQRIARQKAQLQAGSRRR